ncbi:MAG: sigma-54-dependent Fis family transcriptional regulator [Candidatus Marinimicrobia bacterium]|jgi:DNA-binding NtrC family response regulator|nr:sigma-54-dependent Fis family transcriptional regulator [Candidatus Neomarinimicrobiota bacterium]MBT3575394.1 sigma-54-dependent Fis family transcriptional regulator [Candidatus Neomarinimicrobiota bacterium]MBT3680691.1 sigma-54-dependent Fis family transcriptional regulator [Candidatus Neomarinimicrobiota bacterium]MBT3951899.1 sigma-54-dependent Fis family transcriptional regulator [Candidatus Neomarinimicrobiota bacterium]MBT4252047.1 sigma-54-dependent Fis family transcriptional regula
MNSKQKNHARVLIVDDEPDITHLFENFLSDLGYDISTATEPEEAIELFEKEDFDVAVLDINMPRISGLKLLEQFKQTNPQLIVIMVSAIQDTDIVVKCIQHGAYDYLAKPIIDLNQLQIRISRGLSEKRIRSENIALKKELKRHTDFLEIEAHSAVMQKILEKISTVADYNTTVLLTGESGTGKEVAARLVHQQSRNVRGSFIPINCGSIPGTLLESTLFGHEKGSFTGANERKKGVFEESHNGTIFLDEITETTPEFQIQLLRVLESSTIRRVGGNTEIPLNLRVVAATNQNIAELVKLGRFREDLYFRLNVFHIEIPPLRDRREDLPVIIEYHLKRLSGAMGKNVTRIAPKAFQVFNTHDWPGNIRELVNVLENAMIMCKGDSISVSDLPTHLLSGGSTMVLNQNNMVDNYADAKEEFERIYFQALLQQAELNISKAAQSAGLSRQHLHLKLKKLGIQN